MHNIKYDYKVAVRVFEDIRMLSRPRADHGSTMDLLLARITNVLFPTEEVRVKGRIDLREAQENSDIPYDILAHEVDAGVS